MAGGIHKYTSSESQNIGLGQLGSAYLSDTSTYSPPSGQVIIAIQVIDDAVFGSGTVGESTAHTGQATGATAGTNSDAFGSDSFAVGTTLYGRWTGVHITSGAVMLYIGV